MSAGAREALAKAQANASEAYSEYAQIRKLDDEAWAKLGYGISQEKLEPKKLLGLIKKHWKSISAVGVAFGLPTLSAGPGAFQKVFDLLGNFWPI